MLGPVRLEVLVIERKEFTIMSFLDAPSLVLPLGNVRLISACPGGSANVPASAIGCAMLVFSTFALSFCRLLVLVGANERCSF